MGICGQECIPQGKLQLCCGSHLVVRLAFHQFLRETLLHGALLCTESGTQSGPKLPTNTTLVLTAYVDDEPPDLKGDPLSLLLQFQTHPQAINQRYRVYSAPAPVGGSAGCGSRAPLHTCILSTVCGVEHALLPHSSWQVFPAGGSHSILIPNLQQGKRAVFQVLTVDNDGNRAAYTARSAVPVYNQPPPVHSTNTIFLVSGSIASATVLLLTTLAVAKLRVDHLLQQRIQQRERKMTFGWSSSGRRATPRRVAVPGSSSSGVGRGAPSGVGRGAPSGVGRGAPSPALADSACTRPNTRAVDAAAAPKSAQGKHSARPAESPLPSSDSKLQAKAATALPWRQYSTVADPGPTPGRQSGGHLLLVAPGLTQHIWSGAKSGAKLETREAQQGGGPVGGTPRSRQSHFMVCHEVEM
jgi:hypothetical protein